MLKEIRCKNFIESSIKFQKGLNTVLGDNYSTNSIGKSTLLMIIDFVFAGNSFNDKDSGSVRELGHLTFQFMFEFSSEKIYYTRATDNSQIIFICDSMYNRLSEITLSEYKDKLKALYMLQIESSFRAAINPYSRIWGKDNYNVDKPIANDIKEADSVSVDNLIKLFNLYNVIAETSNSIKSLEESKKILDGMYKRNILPKITKTEFSKNESDIIRINSEVNDIKDNLLRFTLNIEELSNKEIIELKTEKQKLLEVQSSIQNKIRRLELNLQNTNIKSKYFSRLSEFFENPNEEKINEIESFHSNISKILKKELEATKSILEEENNNFKSQISEIDLKIDPLLENIKSPKFIVDRIYDLTVEANRLKEANRFYQQKEDVAQEVKSLNLNLDNIISEILSKIETDINNELIRINKEIHTEKKKIPSINLKRKKYTFDHSSNTGTGKSFADLIEFDLAIFKLTDLPFLIHDSILFKNIEDKAIDKIIEQYKTFNKQIFIALDGINKFNDSTQKILKASCVLELSESRKLFNHDWR